MIVILDYGFGNKRSLTSALSELKIPHKISNKIADLENATHIIFPGVGNFGSAIMSLKKNKLLNYFKKINFKKKYLLGICLGMHIIFEYSEEDKNYRGLGIIKGGIKKFENNQIPNIPNIGWHKIINKNFKKKYFGKKFYFLHSFYLNKALGVKSYIKLQKKKVPAIVVKDRVIGVQFHPEKSGPIGLEFLNDFYKNELLEK